MPTSTERRIPPGPGEYNLPSFPNFHPCSHVPVPPKYSMPQRSKEPAARKDNVDPSKYAPKMDACFDAAPKYGFGTSQRLLSKPNDKHVTPGALINQIDSINFNRSPRYGFGSTPRSFGGNFKGTPGPGGYDPKSDKTSNYPTAPAFSSSGAARMPQTQKASGQPGPGLYKVIDAMKTTWESSPRTRFGKANRLTPLKISAPGPGAYTVTTMLRTGEHSMIESAPKWSMGGRGVFELAKLTC